MKKIVLLLATLSICCWAGAQEHLKFKNVPIDGAKKTFVSELQKNDFHLVQDTEFGASLRGKLAGKTVSAFVMPTSEGIVSRVAATFDSPDNWTALKMDFYTFLRSLSFKYGEPVELHQEFQLPFSDGDGREMEALKRGRGRDIVVDSACLKILFAHNCILYHICRRQCAKTALGERFRGRFAALDFRYGSVKITGNDCLYL